MKAVTYVRVSTDEQGRDGVSLANQADKCRLQAQLLDMQIAAEVVDSGISGKNLNRPGIQKVLDMVKRKEVDAVIIYDLSRLTRSVSDLNTLITLFNKQDVSLISLKDHLDTKTASGRMVCNILGVLGQWYRENLAEKTADALQYKKSLGKKYTGIVPFGFRLEGDRYQEDEREQEVIREIVRLRDGAGFSYQEVVDTLNRSGIPTRKGNPWQKMTVSNIYSSLKSGKRLKVAA